MVVVHDHVRRHLWLDWFLPLGAARTTGPLHCHDHRSRTEYRDVHRDGGLVVLTQVVRPLTRSLKWGNGTSDTNASSAGGEGRAFGTAGYPRGRASPPPPRRRIVV